MQERKVCQEHGVTVTTARLVIGGRVYDLRGATHAVVSTDHPWAMSGVLALVAVVSFLNVVDNLGIMDAGTLLGGLALSAAAAAGAYFSWNKMARHSLLICSADHVDRVNVDSRLLLGRLYDAVQRAIQLRESEDYQALQSELEALPEA